MMTKKTYQRVTILMKSEGEEKKKGAMTMKVTRLRHWFPSTTPASIAKEEEKQKKKKKKKKKKDFSPPLLAWIIVRRRRRKVPLALTWAVYLLIILLPCLTSNFT
jgi:hypothetical protein